MFSVHTLPHKEMAAHIFQLLTSSYSFMLVLYIALYYLYIYF